MRPNTGTCCITSDRYAFLSACCTAVFPRLAGCVSSIKCSCKSGSLLHRLMRRAGAQKIYMLPSLVMLAPGRKHEWPASGLDSLRRYRAAAKRTLVNFCSQPKAAESVRQMCIGSRRSDVEGARPRSARSRRTCSSAAQRLPALHSGRSKGLSNTSSRHSGLVQAGDGPTGYAHDAAVRAGMSDGLHL